MIFQLNQKLAVCLIALFSISLPGCAQDLERITKDLQALNQGLNGQRTTDASLAPLIQPLAQSSEGAQSQPTQMLLPNDKSVSAAVDSALPVIKKVVTLHRCMKTSDSLRMLNFYAAPGLDFKDEMYRGYGYPNSSEHTKYHDRNNCISARTMDQWAMPALNILQFRVVYFAEDSGETVNFLYQLRRVGDGSWKLNSIRPNAR